MLREDIRCYLKFLPSANTAVLTTRPNKTKTQRWKSFGHTFD